MKAFVKKTIATTIATAFCIQITACGTLLYPERKGQTEGKLDPTVVALDTIGLLFFLVPGIIAFAVDFSEGTIYLPKSPETLDAKNVSAYKINGEITDEKIEKIIFEHTGEMVDLDDTHIISQDKMASLSPLHHQVRFL